MIKKIKLLSGDWGGNYPDVQDVKQANKRLKRHNIMFKISFRKDSDGWIIYLIR